MPLTAGSDKPLTGDIYFQNTEIIAKSNDIDTLNPPSSDTITKNFYNTRDKNNITITQLRSRIWSDGKVGTYLVARQGQTTLSNLYQNEIAAIVDAEGNFSYFVTAPLAFRTAIGLGYFGRLSGLSANKTLTTTATKMPLQNFLGNNCTASSNGIKFNTTGSFMIWGAVYISTGTAQNDIIHVQLRVNDINILDQLTRSPGASPYEVFTVGPWIYYCSDASQVLSLYVYNQAQGGGVVTDTNTTNIMAVKIA